MQITYRELCSELENLERELKRHKDEKLSHKDKIAVSDLLAETVQMIRRKYELTTMYYMHSELKAIEGIGPASKDDSKDQVTADWVPDYTEPGWGICGGCGWKDWWSNKSKFCPQCGRRMRNGE